MSNFLLILVCIGAGIGFRRSGRLTRDSASALNAFVIQIALPALILVQVHALAREPRFGLSVSTLAPALAGWGVLLFGWALFEILGLALGWKPSVRAALTITAGLSNTSFVGFPLLEWLVGPEAMPVAILADQLGSFLTLATLGLLIVARGAGTQVKPLAMLRRIFTFPPFLAVLAAFAFSPWAYPEAFSQFLLKLGSTLIPVALVSVGIQLDVSLARVFRYRRELLAGLLYKLWFAPALVAATLYWLMGLHGLVPRVTTLEAAMAPMVSAAVLAAESGCEPELANLLLGLGIPLSLITVPLWAWLLS